LQQDSKELKPGDVLGRYQLLMPIAKGGMGQVWAARQSGTRGFQKLVAVKTILPSADDGQNLEAMLFEEASLASLVRHPNVAETLDLGEREDGTLYLVMEWVNGEPLDGILRASRSVGGIPIAIAVHLIVQACKGLHAAHITCNAKGEPLGIVHRDISPQNLLVTYSGVVKLVDFGVAKATQQMSQPTALGQVKGKFAYMSPEQVQGDSLDARADVFAMGIVLYRITTGHHPFKSDNPAATIRNILTRGPNHPSDLVPGYPKALEDVVMTAIARDRDKRFASANEMMVALEQSLPAALQAKGEKNTEIFLGKLFAKRIAERNDALQAALLSADNIAKSATEDGAAAVSGAPQDAPKQPGSQSTMRAVSVETGEPPLEVPDRPPIIVSLAPKRRKSSIAIVAIAACIAGVIGANAFRKAATHATAAGTMSSPPASMPTTIASPAVEQDKAVRVDETPPPAPTSSASASAGSDVPPPRAEPSRKRSNRRPESTSVPSEAVNPAPPSTKAPESPASEVDPLNRRK
jgi:serine/threonine protein kinase